MGNAIAKKLDVGKEHNASAGHLQLWKIWSATTKDNGSAVSMWTFDKSELAKNKSNPITDKAVAEQLLQIMKKDLSVIKESKTSNIVRYFEVRPFHFHPSV